MSFITFCVTHSVLSIPSFAVLRVRYMPFITFCFKLSFIEQYTVQNYVNVFEKNEARSCLSVA